MNPNISVLIFFLASIVLAIVTSRYFLKKK